MARDTVNQQAQIGIETTRGTQTAANKSLPTMKITLARESESKSYRAQGYKYNTKSRTHKRWGKANFEGPLTFNEILYILITFFGLPATTTPSGATLARQHAFAPAAKGADAFKTLTIEEGDATAARVMTHSAGTDLEISFNADEVSVKGEMIGRMPVAGALTASPATVAQKPVSAREIDVYIADSFGTLFDSANKVTDAMKETFKIGKKTGAKWVHNTDYKSFKDLVELPPDLSFEFSTEANAQGRGLYDELALDKTKFVGVRVTGEETIETGQPYLFELAMAAMLSGEKDEDIDGVKAYNFTCLPEYNEALGAAFKIRVINGITAL